MIRTREVVLEWTLAALMIGTALLAVPFQIWMLIFMATGQHAGWFAASVVTAGVWIVPDFGLFGIFLPASVIQAVETTQKYRRDVRSRV